MTDRGNSPGPVAPAESGRKRVALSALPLGAVTLTGGLWGGRQEVNGTTSIPHGAEMLERAGNLDNMRLAAGLPASSEGFEGPVFMDSDIYKWLEAVAWEYGRAHESGLLESAEETITLVEKAQEEDGYLNSYFQIGPHGRYSDFAQGHELYCAGHLFQAAVAFRRAVGDERLLTVARRFADHLCDRFLARSEDGLPGHPEIESALVELYRETQEPRYLELAIEFLDRRGYGRLGPGAFGSSYFQDHAPLREANEITGHAVRALYLLSGMTDVFVETGDEALLASALRQFEDMASHKLFLTGGVGSRHRDESFGEPYELPPDRAYTETCAAIASVLWNWRLLLVTGEARHADLVERTLFNALLPGVSLDGSHFLYVNPLHVRRRHERRPWYYVACCPPNIMRLLASVGHYFATADSHGVQLHQYAPMRLSAAGTGPDLTIEVHTAYPWSGLVDMKVLTAPQEACSVALRIPSWTEDFELRVNGVDARSTLDGKGYAVLARRWMAGDTIQLELPVRPRSISPHPRVDAVRGCTAVQRGPLIYCLESVDLPREVELADVSLGGDAALESIPVQDDLGETIAVRTELRHLPFDGSGRLYSAGLQRGRTSAVEADLVPYHLWGHRGPGGMRVWIPTS